MTPPETAVLAPPEAEVPPAGTASAPVADDSSPVMSRVMPSHRRRNVPFTVVFELTRKCNIHCVHCYATPHQGRPELSTERIKSTIDELRALGTMFVLFTGGEFAVRRDWLDIFRHTHARKMGIQFFTNATRFDDAAVAELAKLNVFHAGVSVYGATAATHEAVTCSPGSFEKTIRNAIRLREAGIHTVLKFILMDANIHEYDAMLEMAGRLGLFYKADVSMMPRDNRDMRPIRMRIGPEHLRRIFRDRHAASGPGGPAAGLAGEAADAGGGDEFRCGMGSTFCSINAYGDVYPCVQLPIPAGNLAEKSFTEVWTGSSLLAEMRRYGGDRLRICPSCRYRRHCHRCPGVTYQEDGDLDGPSTSGCREALAWKDVVEGPDPLF